MVGKPNFSPDRRNDSSASSAHLGAAMSPASLTNPLDQERAASMADEGGAAGAEMEAQDPDGTPCGLAQRHDLPLHAAAEGKVSPSGSPYGTALKWGAGGLLLGTAGALVYRFWAASRARLQPALRPE